MYEAGCVCLYIEPRALLIQAIFDFVGGDVPAALQLCSSINSDPSDPAEASLVCHVGTVPDEVRVECVWSDNGCCAYHYCYGIL